MFKCLISILLAVTSACNTKTPTAHNLDAPKPVMFTQVSDLDKQAYWKGIRLIFCSDGKNVWSGTMVHYENQRYITANHVASKNAKCVDADTETALETVYNDENNDFAIVQAPKNLDNVYFKISCEPFQKNKVYQSIGWAGGIVLLEVDVKATGNYTDKKFIVENAVNYHLREFKGLIYPGMSGGVMVDDNYTVYGINNVADDATGQSWSREMADTALCKK
jgi:hypothetical protein